MVSIVVLGFDAVRDGSTAPNEVEVQQLGGDNILRDQWEAGSGGERFVSEIVGGHDRVTRHHDANGDTGPSAPAQGKVLWSDPTTHMWRSSTVETGAQPRPETCCAHGASASGCVVILHEAGRRSASDGAGFMLTLRDVEPHRAATIFFGRAQANLPWGVSTHVVRRRSAPTHSDHAHERCVEWLGDARHRLELVPLDLGLAAGLPVLRRTGVLRAGLDARRRRESEGRAVERAALLVVA